MADKKVMFKFGDGLKEIKVGDQVYWISGERRNGGPRDLFITRIGRKLIDVDHSMDRQYGNPDQYYLETGYLKSDYSSGGRLYSSKEAYERSVKEREVILDVQSRCGGNYTPILTYEQAIKIKAILEENNGT